MQAISSLCQVLVYTGGGSCMCSHMSAMPVMYLVVNLIQRHWARNMVRIANL